MLVTTQSYFGVIKPVLITKHVTLHAIKPLFGKLVLASWHGVALKLLFTFATWSCPDSLEVGSEWKQRWKHPDVAVKVLGIPDINEMSDHAPLETRENSLGRAGRFRSEREAHVTPCN